MFIKALSECKSRAGKGGGRERGVGGVKGLKGEKSGERERSPVEWHKSEALPSTRRSLSTLTTSTLQNDISFVQPDPEYASIYYTILYYITCHTVYPLQG